MGAARLSKRFVVAAAVLLFSAAPAVALAHGGGHGGGHAGGHGGTGGRAAGSAGHVVVGPGPHVHGGGFHGRGASPAFHHGHWVHGVHGGTPGWWWVGAAAAPLYVQPVAPAAVLVQPQSLYYCASQQAYYLDVLTCPEPWLLVGPVPGSVPE